MILNFSLTGIVWTGHGHVPVLLGFVLGIVQQRAFGVSPRFIGLADRAARKNLQCFVNGSNCIDMELALSARFGNVLP